MYTKFPLFLILIAILYSLLIGNLLLRHSNFLHPPQTNPTCSRPLRVYVYDLPPKFHVGMFDLRNSTGQDWVPLTAENFPPWPEKNSLLKRQHSMEYWLMASLFYESGDGDREAMRVVDPESADVFFVPVFSALSFYALKLNWRHSWAKVEQDWQVELLHILHRSKYWQRFKGRDHLIPLTFPRTFELVRQQLNESIFFVVDFDGYPKTVSNLRKDVVTPYFHLVDSFSDDESSHDPFDSRPTLLFFRGYTKRRDLNRPISMEDVLGGLRLKLKELLASHEDVLYEHSVSTKFSASMSTKDMRASKFCLSLAGDTPSSCRLFDAIVSHCVPVIVSDYIELPFEDELDYSDFTLFFSIEEALQPNYIVNRLRQFSKTKWMKLWNRLKNVSHHFEFQYPPTKDDGVNMLWRQVKRKLPSIRIVNHRSQHL